MPTFSAVGIARFYFFAGYVKGGGDVDFNDQNFHDLPHFELAE
jgi:hypothetical protein